MPEARGLETALKLKDATSKAKDAAPRQRRLIPNPRKLTLRPLSHLSPNLATQKTLI